MRARNLNIPLEGKVGKKNAMVDIPGLEIGHVTQVVGSASEAIRTGITAILPKGKTHSFVPAACFSLNGNGEMTGSTWIEESGFLEGPVLLTNTYSVGTVRDAVRKWAQTRFAKNPLTEEDAVTLPVVGETFDGFLNDINGFHLNESHVFQALESASTQNVEEGNVGGGTGSMCFEFKGGIGQSSRIITMGDRQYTMAALVQANFGKREDLTISGVPLGRLFPEKMPHGPQRKDVAQVRKDGSILVILATDAPFLPHQLKRLARRASLGLARTGSIARNSSGDIFLAFSTAAITTQNGFQEWKVFDNPMMDPFFQGVVQATEESILNALMAAETMEGFQGNTVYAIPKDKVKQVLERHFNNV